MEFLQLKYFQTVAKLEHMTRAAQTLNVSQPSLSNTIARLEKSLGVPLFVRQGRQIRLTSYGKAFLVRVNRAFIELEEGKQELKEMAGLEQGIVTMAATFPDITSHLLRQFLTGHPRVRIIQKQAMSAQDIIKQLERAEIAVCISTFPIIDSEVEWLPLMEEEIFLSVPPEHPLAGRSSIKLSEAAGEPFVSIVSEYGFRELTDRFCRQAGFEPKIVYQIAETGIIQSLVEYGLGVTFTPALLPRFNRLKSVQLHIEEPDCKRTIGLAWHKRHFRSHATEEFISFVRAFFEEAGRGEERKDKIEPIKPD